MTGLLPYGFFINTNRVKCDKLIVKKQTLNIPKNAKALLLTLPKHKGEEFCQDIQLTPLPLQLSKFKDVILKKHHVPIYLQVGETTVQVEHGQEPRARFQNEKEAHPDNHSPDGVSDSKDQEYLEFSETAVQVEHGQEQKARFQQKKDSLQRELYITAKENVMALLDRQSELGWPNIVIAHINSSNPQDCSVQVLQPLTQTSNKTLRNEYFSFPLNQNYDITCMKFQNKMIDLTKTLKLSSMNQNLHIIIQLDVHLC